MNLSTLIHTHGYWLLAAGCFLEGETILLLAGVAVGLGYLNPWAVFAIAVAAGFAGDQFFFWLGRRYGARILTRWPTLVRKALHIHRLVEKYDALVVIGVRFAYGLRIAGPIVIGMSAVPLRRLMAFNLIGAVLWAAVVAGLGWAFGEAAERLLGEVQQMEQWLLGGLAALGAIVWLLHFVRSR